MRRTWSAILTGAVLVTAGLLATAAAASAAEPATGARDSGNRAIAEVSAVPQRVVAAWARNDPEAFADVFTRDAEFVVGDGTYLNGRPEIHQYMVDAFAGGLRGTRVTASVFNVRFLTSGVAVLHTHGGILFPGEVEVPPERRGIQVWMVIKQHGEWTVTAYQNTRISGTE
jgi:uncharacterized protein (TIGR02246 family)